jgi:transcriptional regulator with XRE-family HTH domain
LLAALVAEATRRGESLTSLARALGVTYERLAQWRRGESSIASAKRSVHANAAKYLGIPTVLAVVLSGQIGLGEFIWPGRDSLRDRLAAEIQRMRQSPYIGPFVPAELSSAPEVIRLFVVFLYHELQGENRFERDRYQWISALHRAVADIHQHLPGPGSAGTDPGAIFR